jgi:AbrB family looped-hinge helix DNA binding protein
MPSEVLKIGPKFQVTIPKAVRNELGLKVGDLVQARVGKNHTIVLERKRLVDFERSLEEDLRAAEADYKAGRYLGPFDTAEETIKALRSSDD